MKNKKSIKILLTLNVILLSVVILFLSIVLSTKDNTQLTKTIESSGEKMTDTSRITKLENQIDGLNAEHTTYGQYIQTSKTKIATAITNGGVSTSTDATADIMAKNIATLATNRYNAGVTAGRVGYYTASQYSQNYWNGYNGCKSRERREIVSLPYTNWTGNNIEIYAVLVGYGIIVGDTQTRWVQILKNNSIIAEDKQTINASGTSTPYSVACTTYTSLANGETLSYSVNARDKLNQAIVISWDR